MFACSRLKAPVMVIKLLLIVPYFRKLFWWSGSCCASHLPSVYWTRSVLFRCCAQLSYYYCRSDVGECDFRESIVIWINRQSYLRNLLSFTLNSRNECWWCNNKSTNCGRSGRRRRKCRWRCRCTYSSVGIRRPCNWYCQQRYRGCSFCIWNQRRR